MDYKFGGADFDSGVSCAPFRKGENFMGVPIPEWELPSFISSFKGLFSSFISAYRSGEVKIKRLIFLVLVFSFYQKNSSWRLHAISRGTFWFDLENSFWIALILECIKTGTQILHEMYLSSWWIDRRCNYIVTIHNYIVTPIRWPVLLQLNWLPVTFWAQVKMLILKAFHWVESNLSLYSFSLYKLQHRLESLDQDVLHISPLWEVKAISCRRTFPTITPTFGVKSQSGVRKSVPWMVYKRIAKLLCHISWLLWLNMLKHSLESVESEVVFIIVFLIFMWF